MKYFLGILVGMAIPVAAKAAPSGVIKGEAPPKWLVHTEVVGQGEQQATYYYTNVVLTGSRNPVVIRRYKGHLQIVSGASIQGRAFNAPAGGTRGGSDPAAALAGLDPALSVGLPVSALR